MNTTDPFYYYVDANRKTTGPVTEEELRRLLAQGTLTASSNVLRKGENQWKHPSDFLTSEPTPTPVQERAAYYYADANRQTTGPVTEEELRRLLAQGILTASSNVIRKGENSWMRLSQALNIEDTLYTPPSPPIKSISEEVDRKNLNIKSVEQHLDGINSSIDSLLYRIFGFEKLIPHFNKWVNITVHMTGVLTVLLCVLATFAARTVICTPKPRITIFMTPEQIEAAEKAAEESSKMSGGEFIILLICGLLTGILLQYIAGLFSKANLSYFYERKPTLSSMLWPRFNVILLCLVLLFEVYSFFKLPGSLSAVIAVTGILTVMYFIWLHLNSDKLFLYISGKNEASGTRDLIGYMTYSLRYLLIAAQTLTPLWLLILNGVCAYVIFSDKSVSMFFDFVMDFNLSFEDFLLLLAIILPPIAIHLGYIAFSLVPEVILAILHNRKSIRSRQESVE